MSEILGPGDGKQPQEPTMTVVNVETGEREEIPVSQVDLNYPDPDGEEF